MEKRPQNWRATKKFASSMKLQQSCEMPNLVRKARKDKRFAKWKSREWIMERAAPGKTRGEKQNAWKTTEKHKILCSRAERVREGGKGENLSLHWGYCGPKLLGEKSIGEEKPTKRKPPHRSFGKKISMTEHW